MSKKKHNSSAASRGGNAGKHPQPAAKMAPAKSKRFPIVIGVLIVVGIVAGIAISSGQRGTGTSGAPQASAEEAKYIGRLLPAGYVTPSVAAAAPYSATVKMTPATATQDATSVSVPVAELTASKILSFEYKPASGKSVPMVAYVRPSGKVFVGVSYCIPCQGTGQRLEADGTLTCETCGTKRDPESMVGISGPCKLYPLDEIAATLVGDRIVIENAPLDSWTPQPQDRKVGA